MNIGSMLQMEFSTSNDVTVYYTVRPYRDLVLMVDGVYVRIFKPWSFKKNKYLEMIFLP